MSPVLKSLLLVVGTALMSPATLTAGDVAAPTSVEVFTTSDIPVDATNHDAAIYNIDGLAALERELSQGLPADADAAKQVALQRISELGNALQERAEQATEGLGLAYRYGITKIPAVVFDGGRSVVYGISDLDDAVRLYSQGAQP